MNKEFIKRLKHSFFKDITKNNNGITIITLVVTIIVMLIIAGITINMILKSNGLIEQAELAKSIQSEMNDEDMVEKSYEIIKIEAAKEKKKVGDYLDGLNTNSKAQLLEKLPSGSNIAWSQESKVLMYTYAGRTFKISVNTDEDKTMQEIDIIKDYRIYGNSIQTGTPSPYSNVEVLSFGEARNLFDKNNANYVSDIAYDANNSTFGESAGARQYYIEVSPNTAYTIYKFAPSWLRVNTCPNIPAENGLITQTIKRENGTDNLTITTGANDHYIVIQPPSQNSAIEWREVIDSIQIKERNGIKIKSIGNEEHESIIYLNEPLRKVGDVSDYIDYKNQIIVRNVGAKTFIGDETWTKQTTNKSGQYRYYSKVNDVKTGYYMALCDRYIYGPTYTGETTCFSLGNFGGFGLIINDLNYVNNLDGFKSYLSRYPVRLYYKLETPITEAITLPEINDNLITSLTSLKNDTGVFASNVEVDY